MYKFRPYYIKKEDVASFIRGARIRMGVVDIAAATAVLCIHWIVAPKINQLYTDFSIPLSTTNQFVQQIVPVLAVCLIAYGLYLIATPANLDTINRRLNKYKSGEMIDSAEMISPWSELIILLLLAVFIGLFVIGYVQPIYSLAARY